MLGNEKKINGEEPSDAHIREQDLTRLLIDYLYDFFPEYQKNKDKSWTRENELDEQIPNTNPSHSLRKFLTDPNPVSKNQKSVIVFRGEKEGDGKKFYLNKLIETCYEAIPHFIWSDIEKMEKEKKLFRFPILVDKASFQDWYENEGQDIIALTAQCLITKLELKTKKLKLVARKLAENLIQRGMVALFVTEDVYDEPAIDFIYSLISLLPNTDSMPAMIFLVDNRFFPEIEEGENENFYCIDIKPLTEYQILKYIAAELPDHPELLSAVKQHKEIIKLLSKQERLLKQVTIWKNSMKDSMNCEFNILQIEEDFIKEITNNNEELQKQLCEAAKLELKNKEIPAETLDTFNKTDFFYNGRFNYAESKYYLIAKEYACNHDAVTGSVLKQTMKEIISEWPIEVQFYFAAFYVRMSLIKKKVKRDRLNKYYDNLRAALDELDFQGNNVLQPAEIIINTLLFLGGAEEKLDSFIDWVGEKLKDPDYDKKIFEALIHLQDVIPDSKIDDAVCKKYAETNDPGVKRRIVYFYSYAHYPVPDKIVEDFEDENNKDIHLKCHIISALIATLDASCSEERNWKNNGAYIGWLRRTHDSILQSQLETFYFLKAQKLYRNDGQSLTNGINTLLDEFVQNSDYWRQAHAVDALRRLSGLNADSIEYIIEQLGSLLIEDLDNLTNWSDYSYLKPISYIIEACCTLAKHECADDTVFMNAQEKLAEPIQKFGKKYMSPDISFRIYITAYSVFLMLICGLAYLRNDKLPIRKLLGKQFSKEEKQSLKVLLQDCSIGSISDLWPECYADELQDIVQEWERQQDKPFREELVDKKYDNSAGQIYVDKQSVGMGFMFKEYYRTGYHVYCITCRHLFIKAPLEQVEFEPLGIEDRSKKYIMKLLYPTRDKFDPKLFPGASAKDDVSIWEIEDVPYSVFSKIYDADDWCDSIPDKAMSLRSYGFPHGKVSEFSGEHGWPLEYEYSDKRRGGFYTFIEKENGRQQRKQTYDTNCVFMGYSGAPIVNSDSKICAMHKGDEVGEVLIGIQANVIKEILNEKEWEYYE